MQGVSGSNPLGSTQHFPVSDWVFWCLDLAFRVRDPLFGVIFGVKIAWLAP